MRKAWARVEHRLDGSLAVRFQDRYVRVHHCAEPLRLGLPAVPPKPPKPARKPKPEIRVDEKLFVALWTRFARGGRDLQCTRLSQGVGGSWPRAAIRRLAIDRSVAAISPAAPSAL
jgi:hypothetical protein